MTIKIFDLIIWFGFFLMVSLWSMVSRNVKIAFWQRYFRPACVGCGAISLGFLLSGLNSMSRKDYLLQEKNKQQQQTTTVLYGNRQSNGEKRFISPKGRYWFDYLVNLSLLYQYLFSFLLNQIKHNKIDDTSKFFF